LSDVDLSRPADRFFVLAQFFPLGDPAGQTANGKHYAFEPIPSLFEELKSSFPSVSVLNIALSDVQGDATFHHVTSNPSYSGLRPRRYIGGIETVEQITVKTAPLDAILPKNFQVDFIKIDVEGGELQVLQGGLETISRSRPLIVLEHGVGAADYYGTRPEMVYDLLTVDCGLSVFLMGSWLQGKGSLTRPEFVRQFETGENYYFMAFASDRRI